MELVQAELVEKMDNEIRSLLNLEKPVIYAIGGRTPSDGMDCIGLVSWVLNRSGINLPYTNVAGLKSLCGKTPDHQWKGIEHRLALGFVDESHVALRIIDNDDDKPIFIESNTLYTNPLPWHLLGALDDVMGTVHSYNTIPTNLVLTVAQFGNAHVEYVYELLKYNLFRLSYNPWKSGTDDWHDYDDELATGFYSAIAWYEDQGVWYPSNTGSLRQYDEQPYGWYLERALTAAVQFKIVERYGELVGFNTEAAVAGIIADLVIDRDLLHNATRLLKVISNWKSQVLTYLAAFVDWTQQSANQVAGNDIHLSHLMGSITSEFLEARSGVRATEANYEVLYLQRGAKLDSGRSVDYTPEFNALYRRRASNKL